MTETDLDVLQVLIDFDNQVTADELAYQFCRRGHVLEPEAVRASLARLTAGGHVETATVLGDPVWSVPRNARAGAA